MSTRCDDHFTACCDRRRLPWSVAEGAQRGREGPRGRATGRRRGRLDAARGATRPPPGRRAETASPTGPGRQADESPRRRGPWLSGSRDGHRARDRARRTGGKESAARAEPAGSPSRDGAPNRREPMPVRGARRHSLGWAARRTPSAAPARGGREQPGASGGPPPQDRRWSPERRRPDTGRRRARRARRRAPAGRAPSRQQHSPRPAATEAARRPTTAVRRDPDVTRRTLPAWPRGYPKPSGRGDDATAWTPPPPRSTARGASAPGRPRRCCRRAR